jgi:phage head maturation protease
MLWQHNMLDPIGAWDEYAEDERGLYMKGRIAIKSTKGRDAYELVKAGAIDGLSIGYVTKDYEMEGGARLLKEVDLFETSLVTMPANAAAMVTSVKNADVRDIEAAFRQMSFSRSEAKAMASAAWKRREDVLREADALVPEADQRDVDELKALLTTTLLNLGGHND